MPTERTEPLVTVNWTAFTGFVLWVLGWYAILTATLGGHGRTRLTVGIGLLGISIAAMLAGHHLQRKRQRKS